jgi:hypothetical protein
MPISASVQSSATGRGFQPFKLPSLKAGKLTKIHRQKKEKPCGCNNYGMLQ